MADKNTISGYNQLKNDLKTGEFSRVYLFYGEETYLREHYLGELKKQVVDPAFADFNLIELEGKGLTPDAFSDAVESLPIMSDRKLVIISDFDVYKPSAALQPILLDLLNDLPEYLVLVFYYDVLELKPDKRTKIHAALSKSACFAEFSHLNDRELITWIQRRFRALGKEISPENCTYLTFLCGTSMTNLITEIEKAAAHSTLDEVKKYNIDSVCTRTLDAVIFDLTDSITERRFDRAIAVINDLIAQKNTEVAIFSAVLRHIERLYACKLHEQSRRPSKELMEMLGTRSSFYVNKMSGAARKLPLKWLRGAVTLCAETDAALKSTSADKQKLVELAVLQLATTLEAVK